MGEYKLLSTIKSPEDVKKVRDGDIPKLCTEIREKLVEVVSVNGGPLAEPRRSRADRRSAPQL